MTTAIIIVAIAAVLVVGVALFIKRRKARG